MTDHQNSVRDVAKYDATAETFEIINHLSFDSFGRLTDQSNSSVETLFRYTSRAFNEWIDLQNNWHRWYDPFIGQWTSLDPIGFRAGDTKLDRYTGNGPTNATDPTGLEDDYVIEVGIGPSSVFRGSPLNLEELYYKNVGIIWDDEIPQYIGLHDKATGLVYRFKKGESFDDEKLDRRRRPWLRAIEDVAYVTSKERVEREVTECNTTDDWDNWFKENDSKNLRLNTIWREGIEMGLQQQKAKGALGPPIVNPQEQANKITSTQSAIYNAAKSQVYATALGGTAVPSAPAAAVESGLSAASMAAKSAKAEKGIAAAGEVKGLAGAALKIEKHHQLPTQFTKNFEKAGLKIKDYVIDLDQCKHRLKPNGLHTGPNSWNKQWKDFFTKEPNRSPEAILEQLDKMRKEFGLE